MPVVAHARAENLSTLLSLVIACQPKAPKTMLESDTNPFLTLPLNFIKED
jgi:hypothetical protein